MRSMSWPFDPRSCEVSQHRPTRERLVRAGVHLFQSKGYHGTGITAILERARAPKGCFYHYFPDGKEQFAVATVSWLQGEVTRYLDALSAAGGDSGAMVEGIARHSAEGLRKACRTRGSLIAVLAQDIAPDSALIARAIADFASAIRQRLVAARVRDCPHDEASSFADQAMAMIQGASVLARVAGKPGYAVDLVKVWLRRAAVKDGCDVTNAMADR
jgi:TetR/AcrR family transcriptional regulator, lmrAB and yxaGH operons repressor